MYFEANKENNSTTKNKPVFINTLKANSKSSCTSIMIPLPIGQIIVTRLSENIWPQSDVLGIGRQCDESYECVVTSGNVTCKNGFCACLEGFHDTSGDCVPDVNGMCL
jgi:hypothetical protein